MNQIENYQGLFDQICETNKLPFFDRIDQMKKPIKLMTKANKTPREGVKSETRHFDWIVAMTLNNCRSLMEENLGFLNLIKRHLRYNQRRYHKTNSIINPILIDKEIVDNYQNEKNLIEMCNSGIFKVTDKDGKSFVQNYGYVITMMSQI